MEEDRGSAARAAVRARLAHAEVCRERLWPRGAGRRAPAEPGASPLEMTALARVLAHRVPEQRVRVEAGMSIAALNRVLAEAGQWLPLSLPDGAGRDTVGGVLAAGLEGPWRGGYGPLLERVNALTVLTPGFGELRLRASAARHVPGPNPLRLFLGTGGALGIILDATLTVSWLAPTRAAWLLEAGGPWAAAEIMAALEELGRPWARLLTLGAARPLVWAEWHGSPEEVSSLTARLGRSTPAADPPSLAPVRSGLTGLVPRRHLPALLGAWPCGQGLWVEWQSGWYWGRLPDPEARRRMAAWIRERGGAARSPAGPGWGRSGPAEAVWRRLKALYDPAGVLPGPVPAGG
ncbi:Glycolate dehydrogenase, FAD-binding subunit GlcE [Candidatus Hydrogenisulfobacillus filiaventi]|uniref:Glycolate dehydrogenase, FAD-binding subunit GlcE n=1 Tax=Candidatus Hydrogenisulfobacillus filiaventi TaxID=2707344 RepID=A0A6F8ZKJ2_9FIRM|nr:FAD-binding oxidoreductase [Bacillota bacterium]CAB1130203.1 Glycolate dehydrogenase, FAD-binding subunit GlcE [Candidatus Hydrogenisulfobacillus filiaventi]